MNQIIFIRWWEAFYNDEQYYNFLEKKEYNPYKVKKSWRDWIAWALSENFEVFEPVMPAKANAKYRAWKIWFEKVFPYLNKEKLILVWSSLGWIFLVKYLSENNFPKNIDELHLVAPVFNDEWLKNEYVWDFALDVTKVHNIENKATKVFLYFSEDDPTTPFTHCLEFKKLLKNSKFYIFQDRWHFSQPAFPELLANIDRT